MSLIKTLSNSLCLKSEDLILLTLLAKAGRIKGRILSLALWSNDENGRSKRCKKYKKLKKLNLIETEKDGSDLELSLTGKGRSWMALTGQRVICSGSRYSKTRTHDELVAYIAAKTVRKKSKSLSSIYFEEEVQKLKLLKDFFPDLLIKNASGRFSAVEVELTQKESRRFLDKIDYYKNNMDFEHVFYICSNENLKSKFKELSIYKKFSAYTVEELNNNEEKIISKISGIWDMSFYKGSSQ